MNSDELVTELGDDFYEVKRLVKPSGLGEFCAYGLEDRALGKTMRDAIENLKTIINDRKNQG